MVAGPLLQEKKIGDIGHKSLISQVLSSELSQPSASLLAEHKLCWDVISLGRWGLSLAPCFGPLFFKTFPKCLFFKHCKLTLCHTGFLQFPWHPGVMCSGWRVQLAKSWPGNAWKYMDRGLPQACRNDKKHCMFR